MMTWLLDGNVLAALAIDTHEHHARARRWFDRASGGFATCAITQGTLLRVHMMMAEDKSAAAAWATLTAIEQLPEHEFWEESFSYTRVPHRVVQGAKQVTDAWLAELARRRDGKLASLDEALAILHSDVALLLPI